MSAFCQADKPESGGTLVSYYKMSTLTEAMHSFIYLEFVHIPPLCHPNNIYSHVLLKTQWNTIFSFSPLDNLIDCLHELEDGAFPSGIFSCL